MSMLLLISGPIAVGKTSIREWLVGEHGFRAISSSDYLRHAAANRGIDPSRQNLQTLGDQLDAETDYRWVVEEVAVRAIRDSPEAPRWIFDSVRKSRQLEHFRSRFGAEVAHVHLIASEEVLRSRFNQRLANSSAQIDSNGYENAVLHPNEIEARALSGIADFIVDTSHGTPHADILRMLLNF